MAQTAPSPKILILSAGSGQGHNRAAQALQAAVPSVSPDSPVRMIDSLDYTGESFRTIYSTYYIETVKKAPTLWGWAYERTDIPWKNQRLRQWFERINSQPLVKEILDHDPDIIISTHFVPAAVTSHLLRRGKLRAHSSVVVTDFYAHATWLVRAFNRYFVAHEEERRQLESYGIPSDRVSVSGIPIDPKFAALLPNSEAKRKMRLRLGLESEQPTLIVAAGAFGVVSVDRIIAPLLELSLPLQIVVICGRNEKLKEKLRSFLALRGIETDENGNSAAASGPAAETGTAFKLIGFTEEIHNWMAAADLFVSKPGGLTSAECLACGLPMVLTDPIPGQEVYNAMYLLEHGAAVIPTSPETIGYKIEKLLSRPEYFSRLRERAGLLGRPAAAAEILRKTIESREERVISIQKFVE